MLYKYSSINQNLFSLLINNELWFSDPRDFNDPYDCNLNYDYSNLSYDSVYDFFKRTQNIDGIITEDLLKTKAKYLSDNPAEMEQLGKKFLQDTVNKSKVGCFSECDDVLLMWSHYADSHKGVCLTFDIEKDVEFFRFRYKVAYPYKYPKIDPFSNIGRKEVQLLLATKSQEWAYEKEVRIVMEKGGAVPFKPEALIEIKFGYKTSEEQIKTITNLINNKYPHIKLYQSKIKDGQFGIEFYLIN